MRSAFLSAQISSVMSRTSCKIALLRQRFTVKWRYPFVNGCVKRNEAGCYQTQCGTAKDIQNTLTVFLEVIDLDTSNGNVIMKS